MLIDSRTVIQEVKKHQCLYDPSREEAFNRKLKANAWMEVTKSVVGDNFNEMHEGTLNQVCMEVQKRWRHLRDSYVKGLHRKSKPYIFNDEMSFIKIGKGDQWLVEKTTAKPKETVSPQHSLDPKSGDSQNGKRRSQQAPAAEQGGCPPAATSGLPPDIVSARSGRKSGGMTEFERMLLNVVKANVEREPRPPDPDEMFFLSQMPQIKALSPSDLRDFKHKFMDLLKSYTTFYD